MTDTQTRSEAIAEADATVDDYVFKEGVNKGFSVRQLREGMDAMRALRERQQAGEDISKELILIGPYAGMTIKEAEVAIGLKNEASKPGKTDLKRPRRAPSSTPSKTWDDRDLVTYGPFKGYTYKEKRSIEDAESKGLKADKDWRTKNVVNIGRLKGTTFKQVYEDYNKLMGYKPGSGYPSNINDRATPNVGSRTQNSFSGAGKGQTVADYSWVITGADGHRYEVLRRLPDLVAIKCALCHRRTFHYDDGVCTACQDMNSDVSKWKAPEAHPARRGTDKA